MLHTNHTINGITVNSADWHNFIQQCKHFQNKAALNVINLIENHQCAVLVSIPFLFSWYKQQHKVFYRENTSIEMCYNAAMNVMQHLNTLMQHRPDKF